MRKELDEKTIIKFKKRLEGIGLKHGLNSEQREDAAQEVLCRMLEGRHQHATLDQAFIDHIRRSYGDKRLPSHSERQALTYAKPIEDVRHDELGTVDPRKHRFDRRSYLEHTRGLDQIDRAVFWLTGYWSLSESEIADCFGVSPSRICQRLKRVQECISKRVKAAESRFKSARERGMAAVLREETERIGWAVESFEDRGMAVGESW